MHRAPLHGPGCCAKLSLLMAQRALLNRPTSNRYDALFYHTKEWYATRRLQLLTKPFCEVCALIGLRVQGKHVDHRISRSDGGHPTDPRNLRTLCTVHHSSKTAQVDSAHAKRNRRTLADYRDATNEDGYPVSLGLGCRKVTQGGEG